MQPRASLLITDLDDTIWYWFKAWHASFSALLRTLEEDTGIPREILTRQIKAVHERHHTSEYAFLLQELPCLIERYGKGFDPVATLPKVILAFRNARKETFGLYPTVFDTLNLIHRNGTRIVAFTESHLFYSVQRLKKSGLDGIIDVLYAPSEDGHVTPEQLRIARRYSDSSYELIDTKMVSLAHGLKKPNPKVLNDILRDEHSEASRAVYVGDTLSKDIAMANQAHIRSAHAQYGETHLNPDYELLKSVTHWTLSEVANQRQANPTIIRPTFVLNREFAQLLDFVTFESPKNDESRRKKTGSECMGKSYRNAGAL